MNDNLPGDPQMADSDFDAAVSDPSAFFENPAAIVADATMTIEQKRRFLEGWAQDITARQRAAQEGMVPENPQLADNDAALLKYVMTSIDDLQTAPESSSVTGRQSWQRWRLTSKN